MFPSPYVHVEVDLTRIRSNVIEIAQRTKVGVIAVVKADAYGLGAPRVAEAIADLVDAFCVFSLSEAETANLWDIAHKPILSLCPADESSRDSSIVDAYIRAHVKPSVWTPQEARQLAAASPVLCLDTGMQRFACPPQQIDEVLAAADFTEAMTHAVTPAHAQMLADRFAGAGLKLHAAGSALLDEPTAWLDAVRPGIALYRGAARVRTRLVEARHATGPAGYTKFQVDRFGVILCGYASGLRPGLCVVNGEQRRVIEVGMQSAYVEIGVEDKVGDEVVLLGDSLGERALAKVWNVSEHQTLIMLVGAGTKTYKP